MQQRSIEIGGRRIGVGHPAYIVAEISANHRQDLETAIWMIHVARDAGADAVKLQTYTADTMTLDADTDDFRIRGTLWEGQTLYALYREAYTPWEWHPTLMDVARELGLHLFSTAYDDTAVDFLETLGVPAYKIASFEAVDLLLLEKVARTGKPVILSTGMATLGEIEEAVSALRRAGNRQLALLKCTSAYPAPPEEMHLRTIPHMAEAFDVPVGLSDHTLSPAIPVVAVSLGACIIEKHLTLSRSDQSPDSAFSLEPEEFKAMVTGVRTGEAALGRVQYAVTPQEEPTRRLRRSLFVVQDVRAGEPFTKENVRSIRPGHGLHTRHFQDVLGRRASRDIRRGTPLAWDLVACEERPS